MKPLYWATFAVTMRFEGEHGTVPAIVEECRVELERALKQYLAGRHSFETPTPVVAAAIGVDQVRRTMPTGAECESNIRALWGIKAQNPEDHEQ